MKDCLNEFENKLEKIQSYLDYLALEQELIFSECQHGEIACTLYRNRERIKNIDKKIIDYNALIISLYGAYENFIESILREYLIQLNKVVINYENLPNGLKEYHFDNSINLIQELDKKRYNTLNKNNIVNNLYKCINGKDNYIINYDALLMHNSNMWPDTINDLFKCVGIGDFFTRLKNLDYFINFYKDKYQLDNKQATINILNKRLTDEILRPIKELIEERNRVAHSWIDNMDISLIDEYLKFIRVIGGSIYMILERDISKYQKELSSVEITISEIIRKKILIFNSDKYTVNLRDKLIIEKGNNEVEYGHIISIRDGDIDVQKSECGQEVGIVLDYSGKLNNNYKFYLLRE